MWFVFFVFVICVFVSVFSFGFVCGDALVLDTADIFGVRTACWLGRFPQVWPCVWCFFRGMPVVMLVGELYLHMEKLLQLLVVFRSVCCVL